MPVKGIDRADAGAGQGSDHPGCCKVAAWDLPDQGSVEQGDHGRVQAA